MGHDEIIWRNPAGRAQRGFSRIFPAFGSYTLKEAELLGILDEMLEGKKSIVILGHVNPDGDCIGSCLGLYNYLKENYEGLEVSVYLEKMGVKFSFLSGFEDVHTEYDDTKIFDLCITSDVSDVPRLGAFAPYRALFSQILIFPFWNQNCLRIQELQKNHRSYSSAASK